jgi:hypothetical protein
MLYGAIFFLVCAAVSSAGFLWSARWQTDSERAAEEHLFKRGGGRGYAV